MNTYPLVSIVIPVYNREEYIKDAIESSLRQTYSNIEVVVVDNCSTDRTWEVVNSYSDIRIKAYRNDTNIGPVLNWQRGIKESSGTYVKILFSDDYMSDNYIKELISIYDDEDAFVISSIKFVHEGKITGSRTYRNKTHDADSYLRDRVILDVNGYPVSPGAALFRKNDLLQCLFADIDNPHGLRSLKNGAGNDLLFFLLTLSKYKRFKTSNSAYAFFRVHESSFTCSQSLNHYYDWAMLYYFKQYPNDYYEDFLKYKFENLIPSDELYNDEFNRLEYSNLISHRRLIFFFYRQEWKLLRFTRRVKAKFLRLKIKIYG